MIVYFFIILAYYLGYNVGKRRTDFEKWFNSLGEKNEKNDSRRDI